MPLEIVKVQVPLVGGNSNECLVYDKARKHMSTQPLLSEVRKALKGDPKGYFKAAWSSIVGWGISERVPDQNW
jgi:hypothetical protein